VIFFVCKMTETQAAIKRSLDEFGVDRKNHSKFFDEVMESVESYSQPKRYSNELTQDELSALEELPLDRDEAVRYVLSTEAYYARIWSERSNFSLDGVVFEALVAHHLCLSMPCHSCKLRKKLRWNGGRGNQSSWADIVCTFCKSTYEVKSKASSDKIEQLFQYNRTMAGSFRLFHQMPPASTKKKRYLVIVNRAKTLPRGVVRSTKSSMMHRVSIAEIQKVLPRLCDLSFVCEEGRRIHIASEVVLHMNTLKKAWCQIPDAEQSVESIVKKQEEPSKPEVNLDDIRRKLDDLKVSNGVDEDDWETAYAD